MQPTILAVIYLLACAVVGVVGSRRAMGFFAAFFLSLLFTPFVMILVLQLTRPPDHYRRNP